MPKFNNSQLLSVCVNDPCLTSVTKYVMKWLILFEVKTKAICSLVVKLLFVPSLVKKKT